MATATYPANRSAASALVQFEPSGRVTVASGSQDLGTGTYTIMAQVAAATLKLPIESIDAKLGDSTLPKSPVSGGSQTAASVTPAVQAAAKQAQLTLFTAAAGDKARPCTARNPMSSTSRTAGSSARAEPASVRLQGFLARNGNQPIGAKASAEPDQDAISIRTTPGERSSRRSLWRALGMPRVRRITGVYGWHTAQREDGQEPIDRRHRLGGRLRPA